MPIIQVTLMKGYGDETLAKLATRLTDAAMSTIAAVPEGVTVAINEVEPAGYMRGRQSKVPGPAVQSPTECARAYLDAMEARDLETSRAFLADDFELTVPGGLVFTSLEELVEWSKPRYRSIAKTYETADEAFGEDGPVALLSGTLSGERNDGETFAGIRFIDRFEFSAGKIRRQQIWNDMAIAS